MRLKTEIGLTSLIDLLVSKGVITHDEYYAHLQKTKVGLGMLEQAGNADQKATAKEAIADLDILLSTN